MIDPPAETLAAWCGNSWLEVSDTPSNSKEDGWEDRHGRGLNIRKKISGARARPVSGVEPDASGDCQGARSTKVRSLRLRGFFKASGAPKGSGEILAGSRSKLCFSSEDDKPAVGAESCLLVGGAEEFLVGSVFPLVRLRGRQKTCRRRVVEGEWGSRGRGRRKR